MDIPPRPVKGNPASPEPTDGRSVLNAIGAVHELKGKENVNRFLDVGWILIATHTWDYGHPVNKHQRTVYCLGWPRSAGAPMYPEVNELREDSLQ